MPLRERSRSRPTTVRSGSARLPATRSSRRRTAASSSGESGGEIDAKLSYGDLEITKALASVSAKTAYGDIQLREVSSGSIEVDSGFGQVTIGVRPGVPAWLDLSSKNGHVRNELADDRAPDASEQNVAVRARTQNSDINVQRTR